MRKDARIYIVGHKPVEYGIWDNDLYQPIQVGTNEDFSNVRDNTGDNIACWNELYAENTALYWIWKNRPKDLKYIGICQYRRRLEFDEDFDFDELFESYDVVSCMPLMMFPSVMHQYAYCHSPLDMKLLSFIIEREYPEYLDSFSKFIADGWFLFNSNGFIMRAEDFDRYCEFLFSICDRFREEKGWDTPEIAKEKIDQEIMSGQRRGDDGHVGDERKGGNGYQRQVLGFLSERILTLFICHNFAHKRTYCLPYTTFEGV